MSLLVKRVLEKGLAALVLTLVMSLPALGADRPIWLVVGRPGLIEGIEPLAAHRGRQGFEVILSARPIEEALRDAPRRPDFLLLVGDDESGRASEPWFLPAKRLPLYRWRAQQEREFASDAAWSELDADGVPRTAVGRIPARSREQVDLVVRKTLAYESRSPAGTDLGILTWCGSPSYGAVDTMAAKLLEGTVRTHAPPWAEAWLIAADARSALCGWPPDQPRLFGERMRAGGALAVLMGHAGIDAFYSMQHGGSEINYSPAAAQEVLGQGPPVMPLVLFTCHCGNFGLSRPCLAESLLFMPGGPVATVACTTESHPLTNYFSGVALLHALAARPKSLGAMWLHCQREGKRLRNPLMEVMLRDVEGKLEDRINVDKLRRDQPLMYAVLGDPATRLCTPEPLKASLTRTASGWRWSAEKPAGAVRLEIGLRSPAAAPRGNPATRPSQDDAAKRLLAANAQFSFQPIGVLSADQPWEGQLATQGTLRLVAIGPQQLHVCALELKQPTTDVAAAQ